MKLVANLLVVLGVCLSALGASGFHRPRAAAEEGASEAHAERGAWPAFLGGLALLAVGGFLVRSTRRSEAGNGSAGAGRDALRHDLRNVVVAVSELDDKKEALSAHDLREIVGDLLAGPIFDLTSKSDDLILTLGFGEFARVWDGVATGERLLGRTWSQCADGYPEEARLELPLARAAFETSLREAEAL